MLHSTVPRWAWLTRQTPRLKFRYCTYVLREAREDLVEVTFLTSATGSSFRHSSANYLFAEDQLSPRSHFRTSSWMTVGSILVKPSILHTFPS